MTSRRWIECTQQFGEDKKVSIDVDKIDIVYEVGTGTHISTGEGGCLVRESKPEVLRMIVEAEADATEKAETIVERWRRMMAETSGPLYVSRSDGNNLFGV